MPTPIELPDTVYDRSRPWQSNSERVAGERAFKQDPLELQKIDVALRCADPATPEALIITNLTVPGVPPRFGYDTTPLSVGDMFGRNLGHVNDFAPTNFSGQQGEFSGSSTPSVSPG